MKVSAKAGMLADALALAASLSDNKYTKEIPALTAVRLKATDGAVTVTADVLDHAVTLSVPAAVEASGEEVAVPARRLAALAAAFPAEATIEIQNDGSIARVDCGRSHFRLPTLALENLPPVLRLTEETGSIALAREKAATLLVRPAFAASTERTRHYLGGILLQDRDGALTAVATDGHYLVLTRVPGATGLSADFHLIVPNAALKIITRLLADKSNERVTLRRSRTLFALETAKAVLISKLIDATFPEYSRFIPKPSGNYVNVDCAGLMQALARVAAVAEERQRRVASLRWSADELALLLTLADTDAADDAIAAEPTGTGAVAIQISLLLELLRRDRWQTCSPRQPRWRRAGSCHGSRR
jgi:DNA polymerase-3 subunit beta